MPDEPSPQNSRPGRARPEDWGCTFENTQYLLSAITYPSATEGRAVKFYERLDLRRLHLRGVEANAAFHQFPNWTRAASRASRWLPVSGASLSEVAEKLGFADVIVFGSTGDWYGPARLHSAPENAHEAVVAALFLDGGIDAAWPRRSHAHAQDVAGSRRASRRISRAPCRRSCRRAASRPPIGWWRPGGRPRPAPRRPGTPATRGSRRALAARRRRPRVRRQKSTPARLLRILLRHRHDRDIPPRKRSAKAARAEKAATKAARVAEARLVAAAKAAARADSAAAKKKQD